MIRRRGPGVHATRRARPGTASSHGAVRASRSPVLLGAEAFDGLGREFGDEVDVLVQVEHGALVQFGRGGDQQVGDGRRAMLAALR